MNELIKQIALGDFIQIAILFAILWYSYETRILRIWQKKQTLISIVNMELGKILREGFKDFSNRQKMIKDILKNKNVNIEDLY
ncbi:hypothetical protein ACFL3E_02380 [Patescibacteria group bacterium]